MDADFAYDKQRPLDYELDELEVESDAMMLPDCVSRFCRGARFLGPTSDRRRA
jgi:hypothetical protein